jgi:hypothetical protein
MFIVYDHILFNNQNSVHVLFKQNKNSVSRILQGIVASCGTRTSDLFKTEKLEGRATLPIVSTLINFEIDGELMVFPCGYCLDGSSGSPSI